MTESIDGNRAAILLSESVASVFAEMAFIDAQRISIETENDQIMHPGIPVPDDERCVAIDALMPLSCSVELKVTTATRDRIVDTLFGDCAESDRRKMADDSLLEMLNVIAGSFLTSYFGPNAVIQLELPRFLYASESPAGQTVARVWMDAEGETLSATLTSVRYRY